jgi:hypothetical protein
LRISISVNGIALPCGWRGTVDRHLRDAVVSLAFD